MTNHTITLSALDLSITYSVKDDSPRGVHTVPGSQLKIGDKIVIDNYFHEIIEEPTTEEPTTEEPTARTHAEIVNDIIAYFEENEDVYNACVEELDSYNGYLGDDRYYNMDELSEYYNGVDPLEILRRAYYGRDDDSWHTDASGNKIYGEFNPNREYFYYNGYGNLVSSDYKDYTGKLDHYIIEDMSENRAYIDTIEDDDTLTALFDELEQEDGEQ